MSAPAFAQVTAFGWGDLFAATSSGTVLEYTPAGTPVQTLHTGAGYQTGMCFDAQKNLYITSFSGQTVDRADNQGNITAGFAGPFSGRPESCAFTAHGDLLVGQVDSGELYEFSPTGALIRTFFPRTQNRGIDWISLAADDCTLDYTSEGSSVLRFDICAGQQLPNLVNGLPDAVCYANQILAGGDLFVACRYSVFRVGADGTVLRRYPVPTSVGDVFAFEIDPDGTSFWTAQFDTGQITHFDIATGAVLSSFNAHQSVWGLAQLGSNVVTNKPPAANAGAPQTVIEGSAVQLDGSASSPGSTSNGPATPLSYRWTQTSGPAVTLADPSAAKPTFLALDEGTYGFTLTVTDAAGASATATTTVTATDVAPAHLVANGVTAEVGEASMVSATFSSEAPGDAYTAQVDWGDGSSPGAATATVTDGIGRVAATHRYATPGTYHVSVSVAADGGASANATATETVNPASPPAALWATGSTGSRVLAITGNSASITGAVHSNADIVVAGTANTVTGDTSYATTLTTHGSGNTSTPAPIQSPAAAPPVSVNVADYMPGGIQATFAGAAYFDETAGCASGTFTASSPLTPGVYWIPCDIELTGNGQQSRLTLISTGNIHVSGSSDTFTPYTSGLLFVSTSTTDPAIHVSGANDVLDGDLVASAAQARIDGAHDTVHGSLIGATIAIDGDDTRIDASNWIPQGAQPALPTLTPHASDTLEVSAPDALPGEPVTYQLTLSNTGADLTLDGLLSAHNADTTPTRRRRLRPGTASLCRPIRPPVLPGRRWAACSRRPARQPAGFPSRCSPTPPKLRPTRPAATRLPVPRWRAAVTPPGRMSCVCR